MGGGKGVQQSTQLPPPPQPVVKLDPVTSGAEAALVGAQKDSYASSVETDAEKEAKGKLGASAPATAAPAARKRPAQRTAGSQLQAGGLGTSAVLTG